MAKIQIAFHHWDPTAASLTVPRDPFLFSTCKFAHLTYLSQMLMVRVHNLTLTTMRILLACVKIPWKLFFLQGLTIFTFISTELYFHEDCEALLQVTAKKTLSTILMQNLQIDGPS